MHARDQTINAARERGDTLFRSFNLNPRAHFIIQRAITFRAIARTLFFYFRPKVRPRSLFPSLIITSICSFVRAWFFFLPLYFFKRTIACMWQVEKMRSEKISETEQERRREKGRQKETERGCRRRWQERARGGRERLGPISPPTINPTLSSRIQ